MGQVAFGGGEVAPLDGDDFEVKEWSPISGWPINKSHLEPYYGSAASILGVREYRSDVDCERALDFRDVGIKQKLWKYSAPVARLGNKYQDYFSEQDNITVFLNSTVVKLNNVNRRITDVVVRTEDGDFTVSAKVFVLAAGGIENPRLLLNYKKSNGELPYDTGNIGKYFAVHPYFSLDSRLILLGDRSRSELYSLGNSSERNEKLHFMIEDKVRNDKRWDNFVLMQWDPIGSVEGSSLSEHLRAYFKRFGEHYLYNKFNVMCEMRLDERSRVSLGNQKDSLGMYTPEVNLFIHERSIQSWAEGLRFLIQQMGVAGGGRVSFPLKDVSKDYIDKNGLWGAHHHMCTTRMAVDESKGVVDKDLKVFGCDNLYIAGSSVFGTGAVPNPTLTIVALSLRLGNHLKALL